MQSQKKEISVFLSLCTELFVFRISKMGYRCTSEKQGNSRGLLQSILLKILYNALKRWGGGQREGNIYIPENYCNPQGHASSLFIWSNFCLIIKVSLGQ